MARTLVVHSANNCRVAGFRGDNRVRASSLNEWPSFPPLDGAVVVSIACDVVAGTGNPLSRQSTTDLAKRAAEELNRPIGRTTVWEILDEDAVKPWQYEHWLFPRAADFFDKAAVVLDLYQGYYQGERLAPFDRLISTAPNTTLQPPLRQHPPSGPAPA